MYGVKSEKLVFALTELFSLYDWNAAETMPAASLLIAFHSELLPLSKILGIVKVAMTPRMARAIKSSARVKADCV